MMFSKTYFSQMDGNRVIIPFRLARGLGSKVMIGLSPNGCLCLFPPQKTIGEITNIREVKKHVGSSWRISIPEELIKCVGLQQKVVIAGCKDYIEIWNPLKWKYEVCEMADLLAF